MEYRKLKDQDEDGNGGGDDIESWKPLSVTNVPTLGGAAVDWSKWKLKIVVVVALTLLTSSQGILTVWSKRNGKYDYSVTTSNFMVEALKCLLSLLALARIWKSVGVTEDNRLSTTLDEVIVYPIPALLYLVKNLLQYYILEHADAPGYQILKNLNIISTGVLYRIILKKKLSNIQWAAFILLCVGCSTTQLKTNSDDVLQTPVEGWLMAIVMALLSAFAGVYTEAIMKKRPSRNINVQNFWLYVFGMVFNVVAIVTQDFDAVMNKGFFHGYSFITILMILNHALCGLAVSMVMKHADNIVKVEALKCLLSLLALARIWKSEGVTEDNRLSTTLDEVIVYPIPALLYLVKNLLQVKQYLMGSFHSTMCWVQYNSAKNKVMALLSGFAGVYTEAIMKKRPSRNINVQNFWLYVFGMVYNAVAIVTQDFDAVMNKGFFHGYAFITILMILNHALSGLAVSVVMKHADNIVRVYSTSVAMLFTAFVCYFLFGFNLSLTFILGTITLVVSVYLHAVGKQR